MTDERWNPQTALRRSVAFFKTLVHVQQIHITTCGGETLLVWFDCDTDELVSEDAEGREIGRVHFGANA